MCVRDVMLTAERGHSEDSRVVVVTLLPVQCSCGSQCRGKQGGGGGCLQSSMTGQTDSGRAVCYYGNFTSEKDMERITSNWHELNMCSFYYGGLSSPQAKALLRCSKVGTFLIRNSSCPKYLYSLSLQTERGTTSVRIVYSHGTFRLDSEDRMKGKMPRFLTVMQLIEYYISFCKTETSKQCRWLESSGRRDVQVVLTRPRLTSPPSLKHACRLTVNSALHSTDKLHELPLPRRLKQYLLEYPYQH